MRPIIISGLLYHRNPPDGFDHEYIPTEGGFLQNQEVFRCPRCSRTYKYQQTLARHVRYECGKGPQFTCPICGRQFRRNDYLDQHLFRKHKIIQDKSVKF